MDCQSQSPGSERQGYRTRPPTISSRERSKAFESVNDRLDVGGAGTAASTEYIQPPVNVQTYHRLSKGLRRLGVELLSTVELLRAEFRSVGLKIDETFR